MKIESKCYQVTLKQWELECSLVEQIIVGWYKPKIIPRKGAHKLSITCWGRGRLEEPVSNKNVFERHSTNITSISNIENSGGEYIELRLEEGRS